METHRYTVKLTEKKLKVILFLFVGVISVKSRVDYESIQEVNFKVVVYDTGVPQMSASALVSAKIININDNDPMFEKVCRKATQLF